MVDKPTVIKRPVVEDGEPRLIGFDEGQYAKTL
jgi:arsenate reductase-like glutaredoxin family protein